MKAFPMFLKMQDRRVVIVGGGEQAAQKCRLMLKTEAAVTLCAPELDPELTDLHGSGRIQWLPEPITVAHFADVALVFVATGCPGADAALHMLAKAAGAVVNVVDQPDLCDALTPSIVDRSPLVVAIGTEGAAPVLARQTRTRIEEALEPRLGDLAALAGRLRGLAAQRLQPRDRRDLWRWVFSGPVRRIHARGGERDAARMIKDAILSGEFGAETGGSVAIVGAGPGEKDLMTLRAVSRLQEADIIFFDPEMGGEVLDLARRDAERLCVPHVDEGADWSNAHYDALLLAAAQQGKRVVRLLSKATGYDTTSLTEAGIDHEIVPGISDPVSDDVKP
ncbi:MAG: NAD(P)-dependent oxidoreductase [Marinosulfonomonas sp.]